VSRNKWTLRENNIGGPSAEQKPKNLSRLDRPNFWQASGH
jgi:hypothetical protein